MDEAGFIELKAKYLRGVCSREVWRTVQWDGVPFHQIPEDIVALADAVYQARADAVVECGVYAGGGLLFYSTLLASNPRGLVIGIDIWINGARGVAARSPDRMKLLLADSADPKTAESVRALIGDRRTFVVLDSNHAAAHVAKELELYAPLVSPGSYLVVMDGAIKDLAGVPRIPADAATNNPETAVIGFLRGHPEFARDLSKNRLGITLAPGGFLRKRE